MTAGCDFGHIRGRSVESGPENCSSMGNQTGIHPPGCTDKPQPLGWRVLGVPKAYAPQQHRETHEMKEGGDQIIADCAKHGGESEND
jgi:hypothetical protein